MTFNCEKCEKTFDHRLGLEQHILSKDHGFKCEECDKVLLSSFSLGQHYEAKHKKWECEYCSKILETRKGLSLHLKAKHLLINCRKCKKRFATKDELKRHNKDAHTLRCKVCKVVLKEKERIQHMRDLHFHCPCGVECDSKRELYEHIDLTHNKVKVYTKQIKIERKSMKFSLEPEY